MKYLARTTLALVTLAGCAALARAQESATPEKAALVKELVDLMDARTNAEAIMNSVVNQIHNDRERVFKETLESMEFLSEREREDLIKKEDEDSKRLNERVMQLFREKVDFKKIVEDVTGEVMDKYYTADEVKDLIAFYKTPTGRKSVKIMPQMFADSMAKTGERLLPMLQPVIKQIMDEERQRIEKILPPKPQPKRVQRGRRRT